MTKSVGRSRFRFHPVAPAGRQLGDEHFVETVVIEEVDAHHFPQRKLVIGFVDDFDGIAGADVAFLDDAEIGAGT